MPGRRRRHAARPAAGRRPRRTSGRRSAAPQPREEAARPSCRPPGRASGCGCSPCRSARRRPARCGTPACRRTSGWARSCRRSWRPTTRRRTRFERFLEDELNEKPRPLPMARPMTPARPAVGRRRRRSPPTPPPGGRVFLLGDDPGVGKTGTAILAARLIAEQRDVRIGPGRRRPARRDHHPALGALDRRLRRRRAALVRHHVGPAGQGVRSCAFDVVIADEAHMVRHTTTQRWKHWKAVSGAGRVKDAPYVLACTATPAHTPLELPYLAPEFAVRHGEPLREWADLPKQLAAHGFHVERGRYGWQWTEDADERRADLGRLQGWLADADPPATLHRPAPWGPVSVTGTPVALTPAERAAYDSEWSEFRAEMQLARRVAAEREGPGGAAAVPAEGRADPGAGDRRLGEGAGGGRAAGRGVGGVRRDGGRPDPRGAARLRHPGGRHLRPRPVRRRGRAAALPARRGDGLRVHRDRVDQPARRRAAARRARPPRRPRGSGCSTSRGSPASRRVRSPAARTATGAPRRGGSRSPRTPSRSRSPG